MHGYKDGVGRLQCQKRRIDQSDRDEVPPVRHPRTGGQEPQPGDEQGRRKNRRYVYDQRVDRHHEEFGHHRDQAPAARTKREPGDHHAKNQTKPAVNGGDILDRSVGVDEALQKRLRAQGVRSDVAQRIAGECPGGQHSHRIGEIAFEIVAPVEARRWRQVR